MPANPDPRRSPSVAGSSAKSEGALIERARVVNVNIRDFTVDVRTEFTFNPFFDIPYMSPYCSQAQGEGINIVPEVGSTCWVCMPSEEGRNAFVLGWTMVDEGGSYRGGRPLLNPGDIHASTRDGNFMVLRRGGIVQIGSTPVCQRVFLPIRNIIQDFAENYELHTAAGDLTWEVARKEEDGEGHQTCTLAIAAKEFSDDPNEKTVGLLKIGSHGEGNDTILSLLTRDKGGGTRQTCLEITKAGEVTWSMKNLNLTVEGDLSTIIGGTLTAEVGQDASLEVAGAATLTAQSVALTAGPVKLKLGGNIAVLDGAQVLLGDGAFPVIRASPDYLTWMASITANFTAVGIGSPVTHATPVVPPATHISPKVKA